MWKNFQLHGLMMHQQQKNSYHTMVNLSSVINTSDKQFSYFKPPTTGNTIIEQSTTIIITPPIEKQVDTMPESKNIISTTGSDSSNNPKQNKDVSYKTMTTTTNNKKRNRRRRRNKKKKRPPVCDVTPPKLTEPIQNSNNEKTYCQIISDFVKASPPFFRNRQLSTTESEDSFICFEGGDGNGDDSSQQLSSDEDDDTQQLQSTEESDSDEDVVLSFSGSCSNVPSKKVRFADESELCVVHPMVKWAWAYQAARKGEWEQCARDRERFRNRINNCERILSPILQSKHRQEIHRQRFSGSDEIP